MPAAYYELSVEQGSDFVTAFRILSPTGSLFKFIPTTGVPFWTQNNTKLNIDIPEEIKLAYSSNTQSFGWLQNPANNTAFLTIRSKVKNSQGIVVGNLEGTTVYNVTSGGLTTKNQTGKLIFDIITDNTNYNMLLKIDSATTSSSTLTGKFLYDIELEYKLGPKSTGGFSSSSISYVIRLLQGKVTFNPNITA